MAVADGMTGALEAWSQASGPRVDRAAVANRQDGFEDVLGGDGEVGVWRLPVDFFVWFSE